MCLRVVERYAVCGCVYYVHGVDQCRQFGMLGHAVEDKVVLVGHSCQSHLATAYPEYYQQNQQEQTSAQTQHAFHAQATAAAQYSNTSQTSAEYSDYYDTSSFAYNDTQLGVLPDQLPTTLTSAAASSTQPVAIGGKSHAFQDSYDSYYQYHSGSSR